MLDETDLDGLLLFANSEDLPAEALGLVRDVRLRNSLERKGLQYMLEEHTSARTSSGQTSALFSLMEAVNDIGEDIDFAADTSIDSCGVISKMLHIWDICLVVIFLLFLFVFAGSNWQNDVKVSPVDVVHDMLSICVRTSLEELNPLQWAECTCATSQPAPQPITSSDPISHDFRQSHPTASLLRTRPLDTTNMARTFNASSLCHGKISSSVLVGYLMRRKFGRSSLSGGML